MMKNGYTHRCIIATLLDHIDKAASNSIVTFSPSITKVMTKVPDLPNITMNGCKHLSVVHLTYIGCTMINNRYLDLDLDVRIGKPSTSLVRP
jgi:hypothetical protein